MFARGGAFFTWLLVVTLLVAGSRAWAQEAISLLGPPPSSVTNVVTSIGLSFAEKPTEPGLFPWLKEELKDTPPFFRDTKLSLNIRTYYFDRNKFDNSNSEAWALGGSLSYQSGWLFDRLSAGAVLYTSQSLYAPDGRDGTSLLRTGQEGYTVLGQLYARVKLFEDVYANLYRYEYNTPYINKDDSRMTPNTFEGYTVQGKYKSGGDDGWSLRYGGGYITEIKQRNSSDFVSMSEAAGATVGRGVSVGSALFTHKSFSIGAIDYYCDDIINIGYAEAKYTWPVTDELGALIAAQFTDQRSVGDDLLTGSSFNTQQGGVKAAVSYAGAMLGVGFTANADGANVRAPWSSYPGYTAGMVSFFDRAGESAFGTKLSYDFKGVGLDGVTAYGLFVHGWGRDSGPNEDEFDADVQWRPTKWKFLKGLWLRTRYGVVHQNEGPGNYIHDFRVIINYDVPLL